MFADPTAPTAFNIQQAVEYFVDFLRTKAEEQGEGNIEETLNQIRNFLEERSATIVD